MIEFAQGFFQMGAPAAFAIAVFFGASAAGLIARRVSLQIDRQQARDQVIKLRQVDLEQIKVTRQLPPPAVLENDNDSGNRYRD